MPLCLRGPNKELTQKSHRSTGQSKSKECFTEILSAKQIATASLRSCPTIDFLNLTTDSFECAQTYLNQISDFENYLKKLGKKKYKICDLYFDIP